MEPQVVSSRPVIGPLVAFTKRVVRKMIRWYVSPQVRHTQEQLEHLHAHTGDRLQELTAQVRAQGERLEEALQKVGELQSWALDEFGRLHDILAEAESSRVRLQAGEVSEWAHLQGQLDQLRTAVHAATEQLAQGRATPEAH
jgi:hypothetical protein